MFHVFCHGSYIKSLSRNMTYCKKIFLFFFPLFLFLSISNEIYFPFLLLFSIKQCAIFISFTTLQACTRERRKKIQYFSHSRIEAKTLKNFPTFDSTYILYVHTFIDKKRIFFKKKKRIKKRKRKISNLIASLFRYLLSEYNARKFI